MPIETFNPYSVTSKTILINTFLNCNVCFNIDLVCVDNTYLQKLNSFSSKYREVSILFSRLSSSDKKTCFYERRKQEFLKEI